MRQDPFTGFAVDSRSNCLNYVFDWAKGSKMYKIRIMTAVAAALLSSSASAAELRFTVAWGSNDPGVVETFDVNTAIAGTSSLASSNYYGSSRDEDFTITNDSLGNSLLQVGDNGDDRYFATSDNDYDAFWGSQDTEFTTSAFYDGTNPYLGAYAGETATGDDGTFISVSAVPEPATWALMLVGVGTVGAAFRSRRSLVGMAI
jgi:hypothetical protein